MPRGIKGSGTPIRSLSPKQTREFEKFIKSPEFKLRLRLIVYWRARIAQKISGHPYLGHDDLKSVALAAAYETYAKYVRARKPAGKPRTATSILALVVRGMKWAVLNEVKRARRFGYNPEEVTYAYLDASCGGVQNAGDIDGGESDSADEVAVAAAVGDPDILSVMIAEEDALGLS